MELVDQEQLDMLLQSGEEIRATLDRVFRPLPNPPSDANFGPWVEELHRRRGASSIAGFPQLSQALGRVETAARHERLDEQAWENLTKVWEESKQAYEKVKSQT